MSASVTLPTGAPSFVFDTVVTLSTIRRETNRKPFSFDGLTSGRNNAISDGSLVKGQIVTDSRVEKLLLCIIRTGRGLRA
jgi:hypothetical protein